MKKTFYLILAMTMCSITFVSAEKLSLCQAFVKLGEQCDDFSAWKGSLIPGSSSRYYSSLEVEGATTSCINEFFAERPFVADYGTFDSEAKAVEKVESLKKEIQNCYSVFRFADAKGSNSEKSISYFVQNSDAGFVFYKSCFKIANYGQSWYVTFEFPQSMKDDVSGTITKPYTNYVRIQGTADQSDFSQGVQRLLVEARTGFSAIKGEPISSLFGDQYEATFMPYGKENCYIEKSIARGTISYVIPILRIQTLETLQNSIETILKDIKQTFGSEYGFAVSPDGMSISFARADNPSNVAAILNVEKTMMNRYNLNLSIKAEPKTID